VPIGYLVQLHKGSVGCSITNEIVNPFKALYPNKGDLIKQKFEEAGLSLEKVIGSYVDREDPILILSMLGHTLWMNPVFQDVFLKTDNDLMEFFNPSFGFEAYETARDMCLFKKPISYDYKSISFVIRYFIDYFSKESMEVI
jgi:hypothetical protein